ncbi:hypothetical protein M514_06588 [Trichuris suis]|uniref:Uncharacterized protein n=1 Tax=Trichuris suis TaxID=68888 RepID=A0A085N2K2_9BILA|nr:hypothetical protein M513_06588 [Trichuris suis]KFD63698.1 hypothetical protein M514_06588 [Trichuris suis]
MQRLLLLTLFCGILFGANYAQLISHLLMPLRDFIGDKLFNPSKGNATVATPEIITTLKPTKVAGKKPSIPSKHKAVTNYIPGFVTAKPVTFTVKMKNYRSYLYNVPRISFAEMEKRRLANH